VGLRETEGWKEGLEEVEGFGLSVELGLLVLLLFEVEGLLVLFAAEGLLLLLALLELHSSSPRSTSE